MPLAHLLLAAVALATLDAGQESPPTGEFAVVRQARERAAEGRRMAVVQVSNGDDDERAADPLAAAWQDPRVRAFVERHVVLVRVDAAAAPELLDASAPPGATALVALHAEGGAVAGPTLGIHDADALLDWLRTMRALDRMGDFRRDPLAAQALDAEQRYRAAQALLHAERYDEATPELLWAWDELHRLAPAMAAVRRSFLASELQRLVEAHAPARAQLAARRDALTAFVDSRAADHDDVADWMVLHDVLGEMDALLAWFDEVSESPAWEWELRQGRIVLEAALLARGRYADLLAFHRDPLGEIEQHLRTVGGSPAIRSAARNSFTDLYTALLAAGRVEDAKRAVEQIFEGAPSAEGLTSYVEAGMRLGCARPEFAGWLERAESDAGRAKKRHIARLRAQLAALPPC